MWKLERLQLKQRQKTRVKIMRDKLDKLVDFLEELEADESTYWVAQTIRDILYPVQSQPMQCPRCQSKNLIFLFTSYKCNNCGYGDQK